MILYRLIKKVYHWLLPFKHGPLWGYRVTPSEPDSSHSDQYPTPHHQHNKVEFMVKWPSLLLLRERVYMMHIEVEIKWPTISLKPPQQFGLDLFSELPLLAHILESAPGRPFIALIHILDNYTMGGDEDTGVWTSDYLFEKLKRYPLCAHLWMSLLGLEEMDYSDPIPCICFFDSPIEKELAHFQTVLEYLPPDSTLWIGTLPDHYNLCEIDEMHNNYRSPRPYIDNWFLWHLDQLINGEEEDGPPDVNKWLWENRLKLGCFFSLKVGADTAEAYFPAGSQSESIFIKYLDDLRKSEWKILGLPTDFQG